MDVLVAYIGGKCCWEPHNSRIHGKWVAMLMFGAKVKHLGAFGISGMPCYQYAKDSRIISLSICTNKWEFQARMVWVCEFNQGPAHVDGDHPPRLVHFERSADRRTSAGGTSLGGHFSINMCQSPTEPARPSPVYGYHTIHAWNSHPLVHWIAPSYLYQLGLEFWADTKLQFSLKLILTIQVLFQWMGCRCRLTLPWRSPM